MSLSRKSSEEALRLRFSEALEGKGFTILRNIQRGNSVFDFARSTASGLSAFPRKLDCRFLYDARGSALFDAITEQPEYYLTRTEAEILAFSTNRIREVTGPVTLVELGSGNSVKTDYLLQAWSANSESTRYIPIDISGSYLRKACREISKTYPSARIIGVNSDYSSALPLFRAASPVMVLFLGSSIGNFPPQEMSAFLTSLSHALSAGDFFLLGIDLVKEPALFLSAYNDAAGVTAEFTRNIFARMNRQFKSSIDLSAIDHQASYDEEKDQVEIHARFVREQVIDVKPLGQKFTVAAGEPILVEISRKFRLETFLPYLTEFGLETQEVFADSKSWFALVLMRKSAE